jgi:MFS family permease
MRGRPLATLTGGALVRLYPEPWRERYGEELRALMEDDPPRARGLASLLVGAADAHLRPRSSWRGSARPETLMRLSISGVFCCWIALSLAGVSFLKETEEPAFATAGHRHPVLAIAHWTIVAGAVLGAGAIAYGGVPLLWQSLRGAWTARDRRLAGLLALAPAAIGGFVLLSWIVLLLAPAPFDRASTVTKLALLLPWYAAGLVCALACALAPRLVLGHSPPSLRSLRRATHAGRVLVAAMRLVTVGLAVYVPSLALWAPSLSGSSGGPIWPSTGLTLGFAWALACASTALATVACTRGTQAAADPLMP